MLRCGSPCCLLAQRQSVRREGEEDGDGEREDDLHRSKDLVGRRSTQDSVTNIGNQLLLRGKYPAKASGGRTWAYYTVRIMHVISLVEE